MEKGTKKKVTKKTVTKKVEPKTKKATGLIRRKDNVKLIQECNKYAKPVGTLLAIILILVGTYLICTLTTKEATPTYTKDEINFKKEYEDLNKTSNINVTIPEDNNITYINVDKLLELFTNGNGVILFAESNNDDSRLAINFILDAVSKNKLKTLYYFDTKDFRDEYKLENNKLKLVKEGKEGYRETLGYLEEHLDNYILTNSKGKEVKVGEKRLDIPTLVTIKNGKIDTVNKVGTKESYDKLIKEYLK